MAIKTPIKTSRDLLNEYKKEIDDENLPDWPELTALLERLVVESELAHKKLNVLGGAKK